MKYHVKFDEYAHKWIIMRFQGHYKNRRYLLERDIPEFDRWRDALDFTHTMTIMDGVLADCE